MNYLEIALVVYVVILVIGLFVWLYYEVKDCYDFESYKYVCNRKKILNIIENYIMKLDGFEFEDFMEYVFRNSGYNIVKTQRTRDGGKDLILNGDIYVELKHYTNKSTVGKDIVKKLYATCIEDNIHHAIIITTNYYAKDAIALMKNYENKGVVIDRWYTNDVLELIQETDMIKLLQHIGLSMSEIKSLAI